jgi:hypothetical protein
MPAGIGVQPVEGRWDAALWDGDPSQPQFNGFPGPGVWDGDSSIYVAVQSGKLVSKRQVSMQAVRQA